MLCCDYHKKILARMNPTVIVDRSEAERPICSALLALNFTLPCLSVPRHVVEQRQSTYSCTLLSRTLDLI